MPFTRRAVAFLFVILLCFSSPLFAAETEEPVYLREAALAESVAKSGCKTEAVQIQDIFLRAGVIDKLGFCPEKCGFQGCSYTLFLRVPKAPGLYREAAAFSGVYEVLNSSSGGMRDLKFIQRVSEEQREQILRFNGSEYR